MASKKAFRIPPNPKGFVFYLPLRKLLCYTFVMSYKSVYEKSAAFYHAHPIAKKCLLLLNYLVTGVFFLAYLALCVASFFLWDIKDILKIFLIPALCLLLVSVLRFLINRPRPYSAQGANVQPLLEKKGKDNQSFPSRHVACAFVITSVFMPYLLWLGIAFFPLGILLCYIRFALGLHYPTDLLGGATLGGLCGLLLLI